MGRCRIENGIALIDTLFFSGQQHLTGLFNECRKLGSIDRFLQACESLFKLPMWSALLPGNV